MKKDNRRRISLCFGDSPEELLVYNLLKSKGRRKSQFVVRCVETVLRQQETDTAQLTASDIVSVMSNVVHQLAEAAVSESVSAALEAQNITPNPNPSQGTPAPQNTDQPSVDDLEINHPKSDTDDDSDDSAGDGAIPVSMYEEEDDETVSMALSALDLFD